MWVSPMRWAAWSSDHRSVEYFIVERHLVGWTAEEVQALLRRTDACAAAMLRTGVRYVGSLVLPTDEICLGLFEGPDGSAVTVANVGHELPVDRVLTGFVSLATSAASDVTT